MTGASTSTNVSNLVDYNGAYTVTLKPGSATGGIPKSGVRITGDAISVDNGRVLVNHKGWLTCYAEEQALHWDAADVVKITDASDQTIWQP